MGAGHEHNPSCQEARALLRELLDDETTPERAAAINERLNSCPECFNQLQAEVAVRSLVRSCCGQAQAPEPLRQKIMTTITTVSVTRYRIQG